MTPEQPENPADKTNIERQIAELTLILARVQDEVLIEERALRHNELHVRMKPDDEASTKRNYDKLIDTRNQLTERLAALKRILGDGIKR